MRNDEHGALTHQVMDLELMEKVCDSPLWFMPLITVNA